MNAPRSGALWLAVALVAAGLAAVPPGTGSSTPLIDITETVSPETISLVAGGTTNVTVAAKISGLDPLQDTPNVTVRMLDWDRDLITEAQMHSTGDGWFNGTLYLDHTQAPGLYKIEIRSEIFGEVFNKEVDVEVLTLMAYRIVDHVVEFGAGAPNTLLGPGNLSVENLGNVPLSLEVTATDLKHEDGIGDPILASSMTTTAASGDQVSLAETVEVASALLPATVESLELWLQLPSGATQWLPAGSYDGEIRVSAQEASQAVSA